MCQGQCFICCWNQHSGHLQKLLASWICVFICVTRKRFYSVVVCHCYVDYLCLVRDSEETVQNNQRAQLKSCSFAIIFLRKLWTPAFGHLLIAGSNLFFNISQKFIKWSAPFRASTQKICPFYGISSSVNPPPRAFCSCFFKILHVNGRYPIFISLDFSLGAILLVYTHGRGRGSQKSMLFILRTLMYLLYIILYLY